ncbi:hypothetical protein J2Z69_003363 [Paenibacillus shirakamiensis]|uniref:Tissue inhibitor of metalloproteinase n=1 Tax=Paenibacillus shirakamiensis TaxID=1265935 RepID=A0ABS4JME7_9BACL|nr:hypothetical protein [Paenibacillus shirakamiensis]MBP2002291.1 hypothetical protein [Paenibacillus shirakamiensis]
MKKHVYILVLAIFFISNLTIIFSEKAYACSCARQEPHEAIQSAEAIFVGKVLNSKQERQQKGIVGAIEYRDANLLEVQETWKGVNQSQVIVYDSGQEESCGFKFEKGKVYLSYTYKSKEGDLYTSYCSHTAGLSNAGEGLKLLGQGKEVDKEVNLEGEMNEISNKDYDTGIFIGGSVVVLAIALLIFKKVRRKH